MFLAIFFILQLVIKYARNEANMNINWIMNYDRNAGLSQIPRHEYLSSSLRLNILTYPKQGNNTQASIFPPVDG